MQHCNRYIEGQIVHPKRYAQVDLIAYAFTMPDDTDLVLEPLRSIHALLRLYVSDYELE